MHEFAVYIGRFQPFHNAHLEAVRFARSKAEHLIIVIGGARQPRTIKNPWTAQEREDMIRVALDAEGIDEVTFIHAKDYLYSDNMWITAIQNEIVGITGDVRDVILVGHKKDKTSFYVDMFPQWKFVETGEFGQKLDATLIRDMYFRCDLYDVQKLVPKNVFEMLKSSMMSTTLETSEEFKKLKEEYEHVQSYKDMWSSSPFPPIFVTTDAVLIKSGHVLVVRRKGHPGKGLIALPGGFLRNDEPIIDGCLRELKEETRIKVDKRELATKLVDSRVFDHPSRSLRGRTITHAFCFNLGNGALPKVQGDDDADKSWWMPLRDVFAREDEFFEDHFFIIQHFVNKF